MQTFYKICLILMIVGGINWGLVGLFQYDFVRHPGAVHRGNRGITERLLHNSVQQPFYSVQMCKS